MDEPRWRAGPLAANTQPPAQATLRFLDAVLRGIGQVMFQNNRTTGLLMLIGIFWNSTLLGVAALVGTAASTATAMLLRLNPALVRDGLFGFNGTLVAIALALFIRPAFSTWVYVVLAAACSTVLMAAMERLLQAWRLPVLTAPFLIGTLGILLACARWGALHAGLVAPAPVLPPAGGLSGSVTATTLIQGSFSGVAQVFFQGSAVTGVLFALGLLLGSRRACAMALAGSVIGLLLGWGLGAAEPTLRAGLYGFNGALTAVAVGSVFFAAGGIAAIYTLLATLLTTVVFVAAAAVLEPRGLPVLTLPFVLVTWGAVFAGRFVPGLRPAPGAG